MADIFISYARATQRQAEMFEKALLSLGYSVWRDMALSLHRPYQPEIEANLRAARAVLVLWSKEAAASDWVRAEADLARNEHKLLQVTVDGSLPPMPFNQTQCADFAHWRGDTSSPAWAKLMASLSALLLSPPPTPLTARRRWRPRLSQRSIAMAALIGVLALAGVTWFAMGMPGWPQAGEGVAVTPFDTTPGDVSARSVADGAADEIASTLAKVDMKSRLTDPGLAGPERDAAAVRLGAAFSLGGRVRREGDALHVTLALADARRHDVLWTAEFTRPAAQADALQAQVGNEVASVLHCTVDAGSFGGRVPPESLSLYLRACDAVGTEGPEKVRDLFRQVVTREPGFANAWASLAMTTAMAAGDMTPDLAAAARRDARTAADQALRLDPKAGLAYVAYNIMLGPGHLEERQALSLKGLSVSPNSAVLNVNEGDLLGQAGRGAEAMTYYQRAAFLDPLHPDFTVNLAGALASVGRLVEARALLDQVARLWPDFGDVTESRITMEARFGDPGRALALLDDPKSRPDWEAPMIEKWRRFSEVRRNHDPATTAAYAKDVLADLAAGRSDVNKASRDLVGVGATEAAFGVVTQSPANTLDTEVLFRPGAEGMRRDPRFMPLAAKLGLVAFWKRTNHWPDFCGTKDRPYDCRAVAAKLGA
ncbi:MAG TPA: TIR domain-containing protein [Caulobacteraceae bacterium]|jgi:TolB-like protein/Tfp pilus assembly protein PilF